MAVEKIGKTVEAILKGLISSKKETKQVIYDSIIESLDAQEKIHIQPYSYKNNVVTLHIDSPTWMYAVNLKKNQLLKIVQKKVGIEAVKDIKLRIGVINPSTPRSKDRGLLRIDTESGVILPRPKGRGLNAAECIK